jgi:serine/threonine-protein kinase
MNEQKILEIDGVSYVLGSQLGQGGTAKVFEARSSVGDEVYALKQIKKDPSDKRNRRFRNEITFGMAARNDHVVKIHAKCEDDDYFYYTMDLYSTNLRDVIAEESDYLVLLDYLSQLCDGLAYVHGEEVVHRDIKPENVLVDSESGRLVLADFGIAHFKDSSLTKKGDLLVNRNYLAPEQMVKNNAKGVGKPADIFALGLIITEVFTQQNSRGARHRRVGDIHPFLSDLDLLVERMTLQDAAQRIKIQAVRHWLDLIRKQVGYSIEDIAEELRHSNVPISGHNLKTDAVLKQAGTDVLSAKYIFERTTDEELARYNPNYHCEINYRVSDELFNSCVQSKLYSVCKENFEYEANGSWRESDLDLVVSPLKAGLLSEFESIQREYPLPPNSIWARLPRMAAHYFRFSKDYHCRELLQSIRRMLSITPYSNDGSLHQNLVNAPILWIASSVREYLRTDLFEISPRNLQRIEFERHVSIHWEETSLDNSSRKTFGADLFSESHDAKLIALTLEEFENKWDVSFSEQSDGNYSIYFGVRDDYLRFSKETLAVAARDHAFEGDVLDLLRIEEEYDDVVAITLDSFDIRSTLAKVLKLREI